MKLSHKDLILLIGILVAAVIALSTWMRNDQPKSGVATPQTQKEAQKSTTSLLMDKLIGKVKPHTLTCTPHSISYR